MGSIAPVSLGTAGSSALHQSEEAGNPAHQHPEGAGISAPHRPEGASSTAHRVVVKRELSETPAQETKRKRSDSESDESSEVEQRKLTDRELQEWLKDI